MKKQPVPPYIYKLTADEIFASGVKLKTIRNYKYTAKKDGDLETVVKCVCVEEMIKMKESKNA
ncbi:hypothetical protein [Photobacterium damselae]|uniref:hypothetical protein n=1 Tax=Photobacterium damselae TaxID=38293 RepID=UPI0040693B3E